MTTTNERGYICSQNVAAIAAFGCHVPCGNGPVSEQGNSWEQGNGHNFLEMLFHGHPVGPMPYLFALIVPFTRTSSMPSLRSQELYDDMRRQMQQGPEEYEARMQLLHPMLLSWLGAEVGEEVWHRVHVSHMGCGRSRGGGGGGSRGAGGGMGGASVRLEEDDAYVVTQSDITEVVLGERRVCQLQEQQQALLKEILPLEVITRASGEGRQHAHPPATSKAPLSKPPLAHKCAGH